MGWAFCVLMLWCAELCVVCRRDVCVSSCLEPKTLPCARSKRSRVYLQNARVTKDTGVLNEHTRTFSAYTRERLSFLLASLFSRASLSLLLVSLSFFHFSLSNNDNDHSSIRLSVNAQL